MTDAFLVYYIAASTLTFLGQFGVWIVCLLLLIKERSWASVLCFTGITLVLLGSVMGVLVRYLLARSGPEELVRYQGFINIANSLFYLVFAIGLIMLILKYMSLRSFLQVSKGQ